jgi:hypothetical protein
MEFMNLINVFAPLAPILSSSKIVSTLLVLHSPNIDSLYLDSLLSFQPNSNLKLFVDSFKSTFLDMFHLSYGGPFGMVLENFQNYFDPKDSTSGFHSTSSIMFPLVWTQCIMHPVDPPHLVLRISHSGSLPPIKTPRTPPPPPPPFHEKK